MSKAKKVLQRPPSLLIYANLWSLQGHPRPQSEWSLERKIAAIRAAGFPGFAWILDREHGRLARKHGLWTIGYIVSSRAAEFRSAIARSVDAGARRLTVQLGRHDTPVAEALRLAIRLLEEAERQKIPCDVETHRDTCTETPEKLYALADAYCGATGRLLPLCWDFSHLAVVKHLSPPFWPRLGERRELIRHARQFHFRPFNGHHCQVPATTLRGRLSPEIREWLPVLDQTLTTWLATAGSDDALYACPEMGPTHSGYNLSLLPNSWDDAKRLRRVIERAWHNALAGQKQG